MFCPNKGLHNINLQNWQSQNEYYMIYIISGKTYWQVYRSRDTYQKTPRGRGGRWDSMGMCHRKAPHFWPWQLLKTPLFFTCVPRKDPPCLLFLAKKPFFHVWASSESPHLPPFSVRGCSLSPHILNPLWHIHTTFIFELLTFAPPPPTPLWGKLQSIG